MKLIPLLTALTLCFSSLSFGQTGVELESNESLAKIIEVDTNSAFPDQTLEITYTKHCSQGFSRIIESREGDVVYLGVALVATNLPCLLHEPVEVQRTIVHSIFSMEPIEIVLLSPLAAPGTLSGTTASNFGD